MITILSRSNSNLANLDHVAILSFVEIMTTKYILFFIIGTDRALGQFDWRYHGKFKPSPSAQWGNGTHQKSPLVTTNARPANTLFNRFHRTQNNFSSLNDHLIKAFSWVIIMVTTHAQHCHHVVTCPVTVAAVKTLVITGCLPYQITQILFSYYKRVAKTTQTANCGSFPV